jgi:hypothetical protein
MHRFAYSQKMVSKIINMPERTLSNRITTNSWHIDEVRRLNDKLTLQRGIRL